MNRHQYIDCATFAQVLELIRDGMEVEVKTVVGSDVISLSRRHQLP